MVLLRQEFYKAWHQGRIWIWWVVIALLPILQATVIQLVSELRASKHSANFLFNLSMSTFLFVSLSVIVMSATLVASEFSQGTIRPLLSRRFTRLQVWMSKVIFLVTYTFLAGCFALAGVAAAKFAFGSKSNFDQTIKGMSVLRAIQLDILSDAMMVVFVVGIVMIVTSLLKNSALAISVGIVMWLGNFIVGVIFVDLAHMVEFLKWTPFNIYIGAARIHVSSAEFHNNIQLDLTQFLTAFGIYTLIFYVIAYLIFSKRSV